ncbi:DsbA family protein [Compostimonas suwonensis]|uniref:Protein-disulfide isomerase n=1 Tax=Compostimonas suwonensis TaxID=1048394 RepID=A0A2M9BVH7_9MICO|nr:thioredoxin domain-containing protein [Compostimonas suwonensis]PJJ61956.1 protein-disulfide isomerase [Compostimonas suwonensis]
MTNGGPGDSRPTRNERREAAREKAKALREQQRKKDRRNKVLLQGGLIVVAIAIIAGVGLIIAQAVRPPGPGPANMASDGIVIGEGMTAQTTAALQPDATPTPSTADPESGVVDIQIYVDYLCPFCGQFEATNSEQIAGWVNDGAATIEIHPVAILTSKSAGTQYSLRAANAAACVANFSPDSFYAVNAALFANQPEEGTAGLSNDEIKKVVADAGAAPTSSIDKCIDDMQFKSWVVDATDRALAGPIPNSDVPSITGTPTVLVNGKQYTGSLDDPNEFSAFVLQAAGETYSTSTPSPTDTPAPESTPAQ